MVDNDDIMKILSQIYFQNENLFDFNRFMKFRNFILHMDTEDIKVMKILAKNITEEIYTDER